MSRLPRVKSIRAPSCGQKFKPLKVEPRPQKLNPLLPWALAASRKKSRSPRSHAHISSQKSSRRLELSISKNTPHGRSGQGPGSVDPRFPAGLPFPVPEVLEVVAFRNLGKIFPAIFPGLSWSFPRKPLNCIRRVKSIPDPDTFEKYRDTPPISIAILIMQKYALLLAESSIYITHRQFVSRYGSHLYRDTFVDF